MITLEVTDPYYNEKNRILNALYHVADPELGINIVDLGLVYSIDVNNNSINVAMTLSTRSCPLGNMITAYTKLAIEGAMPGYETTIELLWEPKWNASQVSESGKMMLGW